MAKRINAIKALMPQIELNKTVQVDELARYISRGTNLNPGQIKFILDELSDALLFFTSSAQPVKLEGLGTFTPTIKLSGELTINVRVDRELIKRINKPGAFTGRIRNRSNIDKSSDDLVDEWDQIHPEDIVID